MPLGMIGMQQLHRRFIVNAKWTAKIRGVTKVGINQKRTLESTPITVQRQIIKKVCGLGPGRESNTSAEASSEVCM